MTPRMLHAYPEPRRNPLETDARWREQVGPSIDPRTRCYSPSERFAPGEILAHRTLGPGLVLDARDHELEALFASGVHVLPCAPHASEEAR